MPKTPDKPRKYGLNAQEKLYVHDHSKHVALHNYLLQNFMLTQVIPRLGFDPEDVDVLLSEDFESITVRPRKKT